jgi:hypothetical protein
MHLQVLHHAGDRLDHLDAGQLLLRTVDHPIQALVKVEHQDGARHQGQRTHDRELFRVADAVEQGNGRGKKSLHGGGL